MKDKRTQPYLLSIFSYFVLGCMVLTANTVVKPIIAENNWMVSQGTMLITCLSMGNLIMSILGNLLMEKTGRRAAMILYSGLLVGSFVLYALLPLPGLYYVLMFIAGLAWGGINSLDNTVVSEMYDGDATRLNVMHACYAIGAVLFPMLLGFLLMNNVSWNVPVLVVAGLGCVLLLGAVFTHLPERRVQTAADGSQVQLAFWKELGFYISVLTFFVYVGVESSASTLLSIYLSGVNDFFRENVPAETMVSLMWGTILAGRLIFSAVGAKLDKRLLLIVLVGGFLLGMTGVVLFGAITPLAIASVVVVGLSMSAIYATAVANATRYVNGSAIAPGIMFGAGGFGSAVIPSVAGIISDNAGQTVGMISLCVFLAVLLCGVIINRFAAKQA